MTDQDYHDLGKEKTFYPKRHIELDDLFFQDLLSAPLHLLEPIHPDIIPRILTEADNKVLNYHLLIDEVWEAIFSIDVDSATGPNGFSSLFY